MLRCVGCRRRRGGWSAAVRDGESSGMRGELEDLLRASVRLPRQHRETNQWTASVCSTFRGSWRLRAPPTERQCGARGAHNRGLIAPTNLDFLYTSRTPRTALQMSGPVRWVCKRAPGADAGPLHAPFPRGSRLLRLDGMQAMTAQCGLTPVRRENDERQEQGERV